MKSHRRALIIAAAGAAALLTGFLLRGRETPDDFRESEETSRPPQYGGPRAPGAPLAQPEEPVQPATPAPLQAPLIAPPSERVESNEEVQDFLQKERARMGIRKIVDPNAEAPEEPEKVQEPLDRDRPMNKQEAMAYMREMTATISRINQMRRNQLAPAIPVRGDEKPLIIAETDASRPLDEAPPSAADTSDSVDLVRGEQLPKGKPAAQQLELPMNIPHTTVRAKREAPPLPRVKDEPTDFRWKTSQSWNGRAAGLVAGGRKIQDAAQWPELWARTGRAGQPPTVDFSRQMALALFGTAAGKGVEIVSVKPQGPTLWVSWRENTAGAIPGQAAYHIILVPSSGLQVAFEKIR